MAKINKDEFIAGLKEMTMEERGSQSAERK